jgi:hypothetical protein
MINSGDGVEASDCESLFAETFEDAQRGFLSSNSPFTGHIPTSWSAGGPGQVGKSAEEVLKELEALASSSGGSTTASEVPAEVSPPSLGSSSGGLKTPNEVLAGMSPPSLASSCGGSKAPSEVPSEVSAGVSPPSSFQPGTPMQPVQPPAAGQPPQLQLVPSQEQLQLAPLHESSSQPAFSFSQKQHARMMYSKDTLQSLKSLTPHGLKASRA